MSLSLLLFIAYIFLSIGMLHVMAKKKIILLKSQLAVSAFLVKVMMGCLYGFIYLNTYGGDDTWFMHREALKETEELLQQPISFLQTTLDVGNYNLHYEMTSKWESLQIGLLIKLLAVLNIFSGGNYFVNVVLFSLLTFWGAYFLYRFFKESFSLDGPILWFSIFFFLPVVFWTSGIRKEGLLFFSTGLFLYSLYRLLSSKRRVRATVMLLFAILCVALTRHILLLTMIPPMIACLIVHFRNTNPARTHFLIIATCALLFLFLPFDLPALLIRKQQEFLSLNGSSRAYLPRWEESVPGMFRSAITALINVLGRPLPFTTGSKLAVLSGLDTSAVLLAILLAIFFPLRKQDPLLLNLRWTIFWICLTTYTAIGFVVPFLGATVRYRSVAEVILLTTALLSTDWKRLLPKFILNYLIYDIRPREALK